MSRFTKEEQRLLLDNSPERVLNTAKRVATGLIDGRRDAVLEEAYILTADVEYVKTMVTRLWNEARDEVFRERNQPTTEG